MKHHYYKRHGFTLAEVLITLGVIGVVAVLTLTTVIPEIQNKQNIAKWKKEYSVINTAFNEVLADGVTICNYTQDGNCNGQSYTDEFVDALQTKLKVTDYCGISTSYVPSNKLCDNYPTWSRKDVKFKWVGAANGSCSYRPLGVNSKSQPSSNSPYGIGCYNLLGRLSILLNDGTVVYLGESHGGPWIVVDVNNFTQGPNQFGRDVFAIKVTSNIKTDQHYLKAMGAVGTFNKAQNGDTCECSPDMGTKSGVYLAGQAGEGEVMSGVCCSAKYLLE